MKTLVFLLLSTLISTAVYAGNNDDSEARRCALLLQLAKASGQEAVMDYFVFGIYVNALLIEMNDPMVLEPSLLQKAHQEVPRRKLTDTVLSIEEAIARQTPFSDTITVYRGQAANVPRPQNGKIYEPGEELSYSQFLSTSPSQYLAESYAKGVLFKITVPPGIKALNVQSFIGMPSSEHELLFSRNRQLRVISIEIKDQYTLVNAEMIK